jgi:hypothetical protein
MLISGYDLSVRALAEEKAHTKTGECPKMKAKI